MTPEVIDWLLDGDPAIRWQVVRDLVHGSPADVAAERSRVEREGWVAHLLALEGPDGLWDGGACFPASYSGDEPGQPWTATMHTLQTLQICGLDPQSDAARRAIALIEQNGRWEHAGQRYFDGEVEPCINGRTIETGAYFGVDVSAVVDRILGERLDDGGWNCEVENGSVRSSFHTTINVLEGLLEFDHATGGSAELNVARRSGEEYLLERNLFRRKSTGDVTEPLEHPSFDPSTAVVGTPPVARVTLPGPTASTAPQRVMRRWPPMHVGTTRPTLRRSHAR